MKLQFSSVFFLWVLNDPTSSANAWIPISSAGASAARRLSTVSLSRAGIGVHTDADADADTDAGTSNSRPRRYRSMQLYSSQSNGPDDDNTTGDDDFEECPDEEECEIDWSRMPGGDAEEEAETSASSSSNNQDQGTITAKIQDGDDFEECPDEEECEIDWSRMPGGDAEEEETSSSSSTRDQGAIAAKIQDAYLDEDEDDEDDDDEYDVPSPLVPRGRLSLEMQWQMTADAVECDVYRPATCGSDPCEDCKGRGWNECRFCRGTTVLWMQQPGGGGGGDNNDTDVKSTFTPCSICRQGTETCRSCKGTGWISDFTKLQLNK
jgi:hypothetical protein